MHFLLSLLLMAVGTTPARLWFPPSAPVNVNVSAPDGAQLVLVDFAGTHIEATGTTEFTGDQTVDLKKLFPRIAAGGGYVLLTVPKGKSLPDFEGTPLVIEPRIDVQGGGNGIDVIHIEPLKYAVIDTPKGKMTAIFYYDVAPATVDNFLNLASQGFYDGLVFHRIVPGFVLQGGDPKGDGSGGPGYEIPQEFNANPHEEGVLSMARRADPNSGGSQFFICLDYKQTQHLDQKYTAFGRVVDGIKVAHEIEKTPIADPQSGHPVEPQVMTKIEVKPVTAAENPYVDLLKLKAPAGGDAGKAATPSK